MGEAIIFIIKAISHFGTATHPLTADGTDCFQVRFWTFEATLLQIFAKSHLSLVNLQRFTDRPPIMFSFVRLTAAFRSKIAQVAQEHLRFLAAS